MNLHHITIYTTIEIMKANAKRSEVTSDNIILQEFITGDYKKYFTKTTLVRVLKRAEERWVNKTLKKRECVKFIKPTPKDGAKPAKDPLCQCNYPLSQHSNAAKSFARDNIQEKWNYSLHTELLPTDAYGEICFTGFSQKTGRYVRVDVDTPMNHMWDLMREHWGLHFPNLLISVTGGAKNFVMKPRLKEVFNRGLIKAAESTKAWIITGGMHAGMMKYVGEAVRNHIVAHGNQSQIVCIGIAPWGCVSNKEQLVNDTEMGGGLWPAQYNFDLKTQIKRTSPLDHNHSHFILVDNGTQQQFAVEIPFRAKLEAFISQMDTQDLKGKVKIPSVCVVLEGGPGTLETVKSAIQSGTPAVIVEGSGRAADILAYAYANTLEEEIEVIDKQGNKSTRCVPIIEEEVLAEVRKRLIKEFTDRETDRRLQWVKECIDKKEYMTIFRLDSTGSSKDIDRAILNALLKVNNEKSTDQLQLALAWNRVDVASENIFTDDQKWDPGELDELMFLAIQQDKVNFVELFLSNGVSLWDFLTKERMLKLYNEASKNTLLQRLLERFRISQKNSGDANFQDIGNMIKELMGDFYQPLYLRDRRYYPAPPEHERGFVNKAMVSIVAGEDAGGKLPGQPQYEGRLSRASSTCSMYEQWQNEVIKSTKTSRSDFDEPSRDLFIWSVLMLRHDMSVLFWDDGKNAIAASLTAVKLLKSMVLKTSDTELIKIINNLMEHYRTISVGLLSACYSKDEEKARKLLVKEQPNFGNTTCITLAVEADNKDFIGHSACQSLLNGIWMGEMARDNSVLKLTVCTICFPLIYPLIQWRNTERHIDAVEHKGTSGSHPPGLERQNTHPANIGMQREKTTLKKRESTLKAKPVNPEDVGYEPLTCIEKFKYFYNAPVIIFGLNCISYFAFLILYSTVMLTRFNPMPNLDPLEYALIAWIVMLMFEELRQLSMTGYSNLRLRFEAYIHDYWNILDVVALLSFLLGFILRLIPGDSCSGCFEWARIILALNLMIFTFRVLHMFSIFKNLGPKLVMIGSMMRDMIFFMIILLVFIAAYGLALQAILYPNAALDQYLLKNIFFKAYWQIYGELFLEELEGDVPDCSSDPNEYNNQTLGIPRCPENDWFGPMLLGAYILITNVMMLNLLIAMFSYTFSAIQEQSDLHWNFQRYALVQEFHAKPPLPPPFIFISHIFLILRGCFRKCGHCLNKSNDFRRKFNENDTRQLVLWENMNADDYLRLQVANEKLQIENRVKETNERVDIIGHQVEEIMESSFLMQGTSSTSQTNTKLPPALDDRLVYLEEQMRRTSKALDWIIAGMQEKGQGPKSGPPDLVDVDKAREEVKAKKREEAERKKKEKQDLLSKQLEYHFMSRTHKYPTERGQEVIYRFQVPDEFVLWETPFPKYMPVRYTSPEVLAHPEWADADLLSVPVYERKHLPFNDIDAESRCNRKSLFVDRYEVKDGIPINPKGRTGMTGRGLLGRWGPNHAGDPVVTRWKRDRTNPSNIVVDTSGKPVLEFVAIRRTDNQKWAIPGGFIDPGHKVFQCLKAEFIEEALGTLISEEKSKAKVQQELERIYAKGEEIYRGYADDPRNTDNAWVETTAYNYHDDEGTILNNFKIRNIGLRILMAGISADEVAWTTVSSKVSLYAGHLHTLKKVAESLNASF